MTALRAMPSGHVHDVLFAGRDVEVQYIGYRVRVNPNASTRCGVMADQHLWTDQFPLGIQRCRVCYPQEA